MPRLSVLMPAYNAEQTVAGAVRSTLRAMPADSELVVLDDGSTDGTAARVERIGSPHVRLIRRENGGVAAALNDLLAATDSEFIARMDADDLVLPGRFRRQLRAIRAGAEGVFTTAVSWGDGPPGLPRPTMIPHDAFRFLLLLTNPVTHSTFLGKRSAVERFGGYRTLPAEDYDLWLRMAASGMRLCRLPTPGVAYRVHAHQVTASSEWRRSSWLDPHIGEAHARLAWLLLGSPVRRITTLSIDPELSRAEKIASYESFSERFSAAISGLRASERRLLLRKLGERGAWLRARLEDRVSDGGPAERGEGSRDAASATGMAALSSQSGPGGAP